MLSLLTFCLLLSVMVQANSHDGVPRATKASPLATHSSYRAAPTIASTLLKKQKSGLASKPTQRFLSTYTDNGKVFGCTALATLTEPFLTYTAGQVNCAGEAVAIKTIVSPTKSEVSENATQTASTALSGCTAVNSTDNSKNSYCQCDNGEFMPRNLYTDGKMTQEACEGDPNLPKDEWISVPKAGPLAPWMADVADDDQCAHPNTTDNISGECWNRLHLTEYTKWWWGTFGSTCSSFDGSTPFGDCFLDKMFKGPAQCVNITTVADCNKPVWEKKNWQSVRSFYVGYTIWNMNQFFHEYWMALDSASVSIGSDISSIKKIVDPPDPPPPKNTDILGKIFGVLSFGLAFLPPPMGYISSAVIGGVQEAGGLSDTFFPKDSGGKSVPKVSYNQISDKIDDVVLHIRSQIAKGCGTMLSEADVFVGFAKSGAFTGRLPDLAILTTTLRKRLSTFIVSEALSSINVFIGRAESTDIKVIQATQKLNWDTNCTAYDDQNICDTYWFDKEDNSTYSLLNTGENQSQSMSLSFGEKMTRLFPTYTTPEELFRGSRICGSMEDKETPTLKLKKNAKGVMIAEEYCMTNTPICTWEKTPPTKDEWDAKKNVWFTDCSPKEVIPKIGEPCFAGGGSNRYYQPPTYNRVRVPRGYLGWAMYDNTSIEDIGLTSVCNSDKREGYII